MYGSLQWSINTCRRTAKEKCPYPVIYGAGGTLRGVSPLWIVTCMWPQTLRCLWPIIKQRWVNKWSKLLRHTETPHRVVMWSFSQLMFENKLFNQNGSKAEHGSRGGIPQLVAALFAPHAAVGTVAVWIQCRRLISSLCFKLTRHWIWQWIWHYLPEVKSSHTSIKMLLLEVILLYFNRSRRSCCSQLHANAIVDGELNS